MSIESLPKPMMDMARQRVALASAEYLETIGRFTAKKASAPVSRGNIERAIRATRNAFANGGWRATQPGLRGRADLHLAELIAESAETSADMEVRDNRRWPAGLRHRIRCIENYQKSGFGRESGIEGIRELPQTKAVRSLTIKEIANPFAIGCATEGPVLARRANEEEARLQAESWIISTMGELL